MTEQIVTHRDIETVKNQFERISERVDEIHIALMGSSLSKDGGMIKRLYDLEKDTEEIKKIIDVIMKRNMKNNFYIHVIFAIGGALLMSIYNQVISHFFK